MIEVETRDGTEVCRGELFVSGDMVGCEVGNDVKPIANLADITAIDAPGNLEVDSGSFYIPNRECHGELHPEFVPPDEFEVDCYVDGWTIPTEDIESIST